MADTNPSGAGGNTKFVVAGLLLLLGAGVMWFTTQAPPPPPPPAPPPPAAPERVNPLAKQELILEEEPAELDAGKPVPEAKPQKKRVAKRATWDCSGSLAPAEAQGVIGRHRAQVRNCYERRLKVNNILQGSMRLKVKVGASGSVVATSVSGDLRDNEVFSCVRGLASSWTFSPPTGGNCAVLSVPFNFRPKN